MKATFLAVIVGIQITWVLALAGHHSREVREGTVVLVETVPVDPRDLVHGDYVWMGYEFSAIPEGEFEPPLGTARALHRGERVYVELAPVPGSPFHRRVRASLVPIEAPAGHVVLQGTVQHSVGGDGKVVRVVYGVERYYVEEGTGTPPAGAKMTAELSVSTTGRAWLKSVYLDGRPYAEVMREQ